MSFEEFFQSTLSALPCPVSKPPAGGEETYTTWREVLGTFQAYASNQPQRLSHMVQVHVFSKRSDGTHRTIFHQAIALLRAAGVKVIGYGPDDYETDTEYHHIAATCEWVEEVKED